MKRNLPPLNSLKAFEAAGRHMSFSKAAEELSVTPAAISHQVKTLEDHLGIQLFRRLPHGLLLTDAGQTCLPQLGRSFDGLAAAVDDLRSREEKGVLTVSVMPSLAAKRLLPALHRFQCQHSEIDLHIWATTNSADFARDNVDVAIRYGLGEWPGLRVDFLCAEELFPVCSPALLGGPHPLRRCGRIPPL
jgi:LysR family glycine cleavage system transcriptional activator